MNNFVQLPVVKNSNNVINMQKPYCKIKISLGNDEFLVVKRVKRGSYGNLLISLINAKLPEDFRLHLG